MQRVLVGSTHTLLSPQGWSLQAQKLGSLANVGNVLGKGYCYIRA